MKRHQDIAIGIVILIFCAFFIYLSLQLDRGSAMMPLILLGLMAFLGVIIILDGFKKTRKATEDKPVEPFLTLQNMKVPFTMFFFICLYILMFFLVGYYIATAVFLFASMCYLKQRSWLIIVAVSACFLAFTYFFLVKQLNVSIDALGLLGTYLQMSNV
ncbi:MAG: tripartite tricarboxylate transporter TctB family protein [Synergistaceae bacterium]|nr:tripartite tricarboxylate transporter TctB family protein [Synergistaceae bacterium]